MANGITPAADRIANYEAKLNANRLPGVLIPLKDQMVQRFTDYIEIAVAREIKTADHLATEDIEDIYNFGYQACVRQGVKIKNTNQGILPDAEKQLLRDKWVAQGLELIIIDWLIENVILWEPVKTL